MTERMRVRVERVVRVADAVLEFTLLPLSPASAGEWSAGAHLRIHALVMNGQTAERSYSLINHASDADRYIIAVHRSHGYGVAAYLHDHIGLGDELNAVPPVNDFVLQDDPQRAVLIAGGIGITPLLPMARKRLAKGFPFEIHYAAKTFTAMAYRNEVEELGRDVAFLYCSDGGKRLNIAELAKGWRSDDHLYVCGPQRMIEQVRAVAKDRGIAVTHVHFESFGATALLADRSFEVEMRRTRRRLVVASSQAILQAAEGAGVYAVSDCGRGECGVCAVRVLEGEVEHRDLCLSDDDRNRAGLMTPCVSRATGPILVLEM